MCSLLTDFSMGHLSPIVLRLIVADSGFNLPHYLEIRCRAPEALSHSDRGFPDSAGVSTGMRRGAAVPAHVSQLCGS
jgi:hypothetical protein